MSITKPWFVICLDDLIEKWGMSNGVVVMIPKNKNLDYFVVSTKSALGLEKSWRFTGVSNLISQDKMNEETRKLYWKLKSMEVQLEWKGFLTKKPYFITSKNLVSLKKNIKNMTELKPDNTLANNLNEHPQVMKKIKKVKPMSLNIYIRTMHEGEDKEKEMTKDDVYFTPQEITWFIKVSHILYEFRRKKKIREIYDLIVFLASYLKDFVNDYAKSFKNNSRKA